MRTGPKQDVTRTSTNNDAGDDVVTNGTQADEHRAEHLRSSVTDSSKKITTKCEPREVRDEQTSITEQHVPRRMSVKTTPSEHTVEVTTQEATDGYRGKNENLARREQHIELGAKFIGSTLVTTNCGVSFRSERDEMRHYRNETARCFHAI